MRFYVLLGIKPTFNISLPSSDIKLNLDFLHHHHLNKFIIRGYLKFYFTPLLKIVLS